MKIVKSKQLVLGLAASALATGLATATASAEEVLNVYNWSDYIAEDTIANFEAETGIKVTYDMGDLNEVLEAKMLAGSSGYDVVVPTGDFLARGREAGAYRSGSVTDCELRKSGHGCARVCQPADRHRQCWGRICGAPQVLPIMST